MDNFITIAKSVLLKNLPHDGVFVNYTLTHGNDTLYMAKFVSEGNVIAFANNCEQIDEAYKLFEDNFQDNAHIVLDNPINANKYISGQINGFMLSAVSVDMTDDEIITVIDNSLEIMCSHSVGMLTIDKSQTKSIEYIKSMDREKVSVMQLCMANETSPITYLIEKLK